MTYNVFGGTLNLTPLQHQHSRYLLGCAECIGRRYYNYTLMQSHSARHHPSHKLFIRRELSMDLHEVSSEPRNMTTSLNDFPFI